jgi:hypothetical protein
VRPERSERRRLESCRRPDPGLSLPYQPALASVADNFGVIRSVGTPWRRSSIFLSLACSTVLLTRGHVDQHLGDGSGLACGVVCTERLDVFLLIFGLAAAAGTLLGGRAADRSATATLLVASIVLLGALGVLYLVGATPVLVLFALAAWGLAGFAIIPALQLQVITLAGTGGDLAATLGASAVNAGIAAGSLIGGVALARHGASAPLLVATTMCALAIPATWATRFLTPPAEDPSNTAAVDLNGSGLQLPQLGLEGT